ncbi:hypothetical protein AO371_0740 [Moraxella catarrhalis]|nr:hypothetical protein AO380_1553 [Moraxella catarrhalis]OAV25383.1 hypothetical protein AO371_0740 [Moraxella catarrhalis]OAV31869.1 hypothetical protein AO367_0389 [Moraxella catarrhalis]
MVYFTASAFIFQRKFDAISLGYSIQNLSQAVNPKVSTYLGFFRR